MRCGWLEVLTVAGWMYILLCLTDIISLFNRWNTLRSLPSLRAARGSRCTSWMCRQMPRPVWPGTPTTARSRTSRVWDFLLYPLPTLFFSSVSSFFFRLSLFLLYFFLLFLFSCFPFFLLLSHLLSPASPSSFSSPSLPTIFSLFFFSRHSPLALPSSLPSFSLSSPLAASLSLAFFYPIFPPYFPLSIRVVQIFLAFGAGKMLTLVTANYGRITECLP